MPQHVTPLTVESIRAFLASSGEMQKRARNPRAKTMMHFPEQMPDVARGENMIHLMRGQMDALLGPGTGDHMAMQTRLMDVLNVLSHGTVEEEIERTRAKADRVAQMGARMPAEMLEQMRGGMDMRIAQLRLITDEEVGAVLACLDELEPAFPLQVPEVRVRHVPGERERREAEADAERASGDAEDAPRLTPERIRQVLAVVPQIADSQKVRDFVGGSPPYAYLGMDVEKAFGKQVMKRLAGLGENPEAFYADLGWIRIISRIVSKGGTVAESLARLKMLEQPEAWRNPYERPGKAAKRAAGFASGMGQLADLHRKISRQAEDAVRQCLPEIERVFGEAAAA
jgi:hypothetical protein